MGRGLLKIPLLAAAAWCRPLLLPMNRPMVNLKLNIVFRSIEAGGLAGRVTERVLTVRWDALSPRCGRPNQTAIAPVIEKRLSKSQVQQFQQLLEDQRFPNLNNLRYLSDAALADYPTRTLQGMGSSVEYIDLEVDRLPTALRSVIQAWNGL